MWTGKVNNYTRRVMIQILSLFLIATLFTACGGDQSIDSLTFPHGGEGSSQNVFRESYRFEFNGCDTSKREFIANDPDSLNKQLCAALQEDKSNNYCAESLRRDHFNKRCKGPWQTPSQPLPAPTSVPEPTASPSEQDVNRLLELLAHLIIDSYRLEEALTKSEVVSVTAFMEDLKTCGLSYLGPKCIDYVTTRGQVISSRWDMRSAAVLVRLKIKGITPPVLFGFEKSALNRLNVYLQLKPFSSGRAVTEYLADKTAVQLVSTADLAQNTLDSAWKRLENPSEIRQVFHDTETVLSLESTRPRERESVDAKLAALLLKGKHLVGESTRPIYQERLLDLFANSIRASDKLVAAFADELLRSSDSTVRQIAATYVLSADANRANVKPWVRQALGHARWDARRRAIVALAGSHPSLQDQLLIIARIEDSDEDVRKAAVSAVEELSLGSAHVEELSRLRSSNRWDVRRDAARLLGRISDAKATLTVIRLLNDSDEDVRKEAYSQLAKRKLSEESLPELFKLLKSNQWTVRRDALRLVGTIPGELATAALISRMGDSDQDVRSQSMAELKNRALTLAAVAQLDTFASDSNWEVRRNVAVLLGRIDGPKATLSLLNQLGDADQDVRSQVMSIVRERKLTNEMVEPLSRLLAHSNWEVRRDAAFLLGRISSAQSREALISRLAKETDDDVKNQIIASIARIKG
jgi:HEAT repeat protein